MKRIFTIVDNARPLSPCHDAFVVGQRLVERGHNVLTVELRDPMPGSEGSSRCSHSIVWPRRFSWSGFQQLRRLIQDTSPDEIHLWGHHNHWLPHALTGLVRCPVRQIVGTVSNRSRPGGAWNWTRAVSRSVHQVSRFPDPGVGYLPWFGYSTKTVPGIRQLVRARLGIPEHARLVGTIGPLTARSGIKDFMWAGDLLRCIRDDVYWLVMGDGPQRWRLQRFATQLEVSDRLQLLDYRDDIMEIVAALDVYVQPSTGCDNYSGLRAAISASVPSVGISRSVHEKLISHDRTGYLVERGARNEIARCVNRFVSEPAIVDEFRASIPAWSRKALCGVDEAIDRLLASAGSKRVRRAG